MALADEYTIGMQWLYSNALGGVKVQVPESQKDRAIEVLSQDYSKSLVLEGCEDEFCCPLCKSSNVEFITRGKRMAFVVFLALQFPLWPFRRQIKCKECGNISDYKT